MGFVLSDLGRIDEAKELLHQSLDGNRRILGDEHPPHSIPIASWAEVIGMQGRRDEAETCSGTAWKPSAGSSAPIIFATLQTAKRLEDLLNETTRSRQAGSRQTSLSTWATGPLNGDPQPQSPADCISATETLSCGSSYAVLDASCTFAKASVAALRR